MRRVVAGMCVCVVACAAPSTSATTPVDSVFDALSAAEVRAAVVATRADTSARLSRIVSVWLDEPDKAAVLAAQSIARVARVVTYDMARDSLREYLVDVKAERIRSSRVIANAQPMLTADDASLAERIVRSDKRWIAAMSKRGITDLTHVVPGAWSAGYFGDSTERGRIVRVIPYLRDMPHDREYLRPVEGIVAEVNLTRSVVTSFSDEGVTPVAPTRVIAAESGFDATSPGSGARDDGIQLNGQSISWRQWRLHVAAHPREGVVLHRVRYVEGARERSMLYRASVSEIVVPYGDPDRGWFVRNAIDEGELGLGQFVHPLRDGVDVPKGAHLRSAIIADERGIPVEHPRAIAVYERDGGLAWRHLDLGRRARELVIEWIASLGNYEYGFAWILHEDGTIEQRTTLTGIMSVKGATAPTRDAGADTLSTDDVHGQRITDQLVAPHHQHFFAFRLDTDVDGATHQRVVEVDGHAASAQTTPDPHNGMAAASTILATERDAQRFTSGEVARRWMVQNTSVRNATGGRVGLSLLPAENARPLADSTSWIRKRAGFLNAQLWVTPYRANELYAAGDYPNQSRGGDGLPSFTRRNASVADTDVVLWYVMGITHLPRPEDWPVMPAHVAGFKLVPTGFFDANPLMKRQSR